MGEETKMTTKETFFYEFPSVGWPNTEQLKPYFVASGKNWFHETGNDSAVFTLVGVAGDPDKPRGRGRRDLKLHIWGDPRYGVLLWYHRDGIEDGVDFFSKGDLSKIKLYMRTTHDDIRPIGLFIPFEKAWLAVEDFINGEGALSDRIEWIAAEELPVNTFPDPFDDVEFADEEDRYTPPWLR